MFSKDLEHIRVLVADICTSKYNRYYRVSHDLPVGQRCCTPSTLHSAIVFQQIFCIKMFAKLVYNTK